VGVRPQLLLVVACSTSRAPASDPPARAVDIETAPAIAIPLAATVRARTQLFAARVAEIVAPARGAVTAELVEPGAAVRAGEPVLRFAAAPLGELALRSPVRGRLIAVDGGGGAVVVAGTVVARVAATEQLALTLSVPAVDADAVAAAATFSTTTWPFHEFAGRVARVAANGGVADVAIDVDNRAGMLDAGVIADVTVVLHRARPSIFVPASALAEVDGRVQVRRVRAGALDTIDVTRGASIGDRVEVVGAIAAGDRVVVGTR
jgi:hypothetical protein